jgi:hypothetical protein
MYRYSNTLSEVPIWYKIRKSQQKKPPFQAANLLILLVELDGIEPTTS